MTAGMFLVYTGVKNVPVLDGLRQIMRGQAITEGSQSVSNLTGDGAGWTKRGYDPGSGTDNGKGDTGKTSTAPASVPRGEIQAYAQQLLNEYGWGDQWNSFNALVMGESGWNPAATNASSGAYGIPQSLPASKLDAYGDRHDYRVQLRWMMDYIKNRADYGDPNAAYSKWLSRSPHWY